MPSDCARRSPWSLCSDAGQSVFVGWDDLGPDAQSGRHWLASFGQCLFRCGLQKGNRPGDPKVCGAEGLETGSYLAAGGFVAGLELSPPDLSALSQPASTKPTTSSKRRLIFFMMFSRGRLPAGERPCTHRNPLPQPALAAGLVMFPGNLFSAVRALADRRTHSVARTLGKAPALPSANLRGFNPPSWMVSSQRQARPAAVFCAPRRWRCRSRAPCLRMGCSSPGP